MIERNHFSKSCRFAGYVKMILDGLDPKMLDLTGILLWSYKISTTYETHGTLQ